MKVIRDEDKKSNTYIKKIKIKKKKTKHNSKSLNDVNVTTENYNDLVVYMADGSKPRYANIEKNKVRALELMSKQHLRNKECEEKLVSKMSNNITMAGVCGIAGLIFAGVMATGVPNQDYLLFANALRISFPTIILVYGGIKGIIAKKIYNKIKEIKKNDYLLENEEVLSEADLENENILENVKDKDKAVIAEIKEEKDKENDKHYFDINSIDKLSLPALKEIKRNIERENYLGLVTVQAEVKDNTESKGKPYVKK